MKRDDFEEGLRELDQEFEVEGVPPSVHFEKCESLIRFSCCDM